MKQSNLLIFIITHIRLNRFTFKGILKRSIEWPPIGQFGQGDHKNVIVEVNGPVYLYK